MLVGDRMAYPQPLARTCCCQVGPGITGRGPPRPVNEKASSMITGTGPAARAGVVNDNWISTLICGYEELSTRPINFFVITGTSPFSSSVVAVVSHFTFGMSFGWRP